MKLDRVMIAAPKSGSGKTTITCGLLLALKKAGQKVVSYKCGPDYIDPMFHQKVIDIPSKNLDTFFSGEEETRRLLLKNRTREEFAIMEGVMGLFDGLGGIREEGSSYHLAKVTKTPIILVVDVKGMGFSAIPLIAGFLQYDKEKLIKGVILNRMSKACYEMLKPLMEKELGICVVGYVPDCKQLHLESRHLGLVLPEEIEDVKERLAQTALALQETVSMAQIIRIGKAAEEVKEEHRTAGPEQVTWKGGEKPVIAVARDEAFCFYYEDNLALLEENGARLAYFSPLYDTALPQNSSGLLLGGGYPELYGEKLSKNIRMRKEIKAAIKSGMPVVAECGGFMYLHSLVSDKEGKSYAMVGQLPFACRDTGKLVRFGYIELEERASRFLPPGERIKGHEFHYYDSEDNGDDCVAVKPVTGKRYTCVMEGENYWLGFPHLYYPSNPAFAKSFVEKAGKYRKEIQKH